MDPNFFLESESGSAELCQPLNWVPTDDTPANDSSAGIVRTLWQELQRRRSQNSGYEHPAEGRRNNSQSNMRIRSGSNDSTKNTHPPKNRPVIDNSKNENENKKRNIVSSNPE